VPRLKLQPFGEPALFQRARGQTAGGLQQFGIAVVARLPSL
jgi:hypothetical protein